MSAEPRAASPLGPAWDHVLSAPELAKRLVAGPALDQALPHARIIGAGERLYAMTPLGERIGSADVSCVCSVGAFDGVHAGHRALVASAVDEAAGRGCASVAVTFSPDPAAVLSGPIVNESLLSVADRVRMLATLGVDAVLVVPFDERLAATPHDRFLVDWLVRPLCAVSLHVGANFRMGAGGRGDVRALAAAGKPLGVAVHGHELVCEDGRAVSATRIRGLLHEGKVEAAAGLLRRYHLVRGHVEHGRGEGTSFGFPTANVRVDVSACLPAEGVYAALVCDGSSAWPAAVNVGAPRSFGGEQGEPFLEATLVGFQGNLYGAELSVSFVAWLRAPHTFASLDELERTVLGNVAWVRSYLGEGAIL